MSVIGIEGASCGVRTIKGAADRSGGVVNVVNPLELQRQMRTILDNPPLAINVSVSLQVHPSWGFMTSNNNAILDKKNWESKQQV